MRRVGIVFLGGGLGSCLRAALLAWLAPNGAAAPVLAINLAGAFLLGVVYVLADEAGLFWTQARLFLAVGVLGGFTTFSTFGWGVDTMFAGHDVGTACLYVVASVGGGAAAVAIGLATGRESVVAVEYVARTVVGRIEQRATRRASSATGAMRAVETEDREESA